MFQQVVIAVVLDVPAVLHMLVGLVELDVRLQIL